jgi:hypothetical protein
MAGINGVIGWLGGCAGVLGKRRSDNPVRLDSSRVTPGKEGSTHPPFSAGEARLDVFGVSN